jgi:hypothetical protein
LGNNSTNLYRVTIASHGDADKLSRLDIDPVVTVSGGYLILAEQNVSALLTKMNLAFHLISINVNRHNLFTITERTPDQIDEFSLIFNERGLKLYRVDDGEIERAQTNYRLGHPPTEHLRIRYRGPVRLDVGRKTAIELDSLVNRVLQDSIGSYLNHMDGYGHRWWGSSGNLSCGQWLFNRLIDYGFDSVYFDYFTRLNQTGHVVNGRNVIAVKLGTEFPEIHIIVGAHYDTEYLSPGADDNGSGTAGVLEIARVMANVDTRMTTVFVFFDAEEEIMLGSIHYSANAADENRKIPLMLNLDMIGHGENDTDAFVFYYDDETYAQLWTELAATIPGINIVGHPSDSLGGISDQGPFGQLGYKVAFVMEYIFSTHYHGADDSAVYLNFDYVARMTKASLATLYVTDQQFTPEYELYVTAACEFPELIHPNTPTPVDIFVREYGGAQLIPGSILLHCAVNGGEETTVQMIEVGNHIYSANLPPMNCLDRIRYYFSAEDVSQGIVYYPGQNETILANVGTGTYTVFEDNFETDQGWTVTTDAIIGEWEHVVPTRDYDGNGCYYRVWSSHGGLTNGFTSLKSPPLKSTELTVVSNMPANIVIPGNPGFWQIHFEFGFPPVVRSGSRWRKLKSLFIILPGRLCNFG